MDIYRDRFLSAMLGVMIFIVFEPFKFPSGWKRYLIMLAFVILVIVCVMLSELVVSKVLRMPNDLSRGIQYIVRRNCFFMPINITLLTISVATLFYLVDADPTVDYFSFGSLAYLVVCLICISIFQLLFWKNRYSAQILTRELCEAQRINGMLQERERLKNMEVKTADKHSENVSETSKDIVITGSTKESLQLNADDLLFAESSGNYVTVHYLKDEKVFNIDIRTTIKDVVELFAPYPNIMRCHRAFVVNLSNIISLERRSSGMELLMRASNVRVPVSKSYVQDLKQRLQNPA